MTIVQGIVRTCAASASLLLFYVAWSVYEDEEKHLQNKIENWWIGWDDMQKRMVPAFSRVVSRRAKEVLDHVFAGPLLSVDSISAATCLSVASYGLSSGWILFSLYGDWGGRKKIGLGADEWSDFAVAWISVAVGLAYFLVCLAPAISPALRRLPKTVFSHTVKVLAASSVIGFAAFAAWLAGAMPGLPSPPQGNLGAVFFFSPFLVVVGLAIATGFTLLVVSIARGSMARVAEIGSEWAIFWRLLAVLLFVGGYFAWFLRATYGVAILSPSRLALTMPLLALAAAAEVAAGVLLLLFGIAGLMLLHRAIWSPINRLLYVLQRYNVVEKKKWLLGTGVLLLGVAMSGKYSWQLPLKLVGL
jgi:hypothetical protein